MPEGRRVMIGARVSEAMAAAVDEVRGDVSRSAWVEAAIRNALAEAGASPAASPAAYCAGDERAPVMERVELHNGKSVMVTAVTNRCPHPKSRVIKGFCGACGTGGLGDGRKDSA